MPDLTEQLSSLLQDPEGMARIRSMAEGLFSQNKQEPVKETTPEAPDFDISKITQMAAMLNRGQDDDRVRLLYALRPHLSPEKQKRVDSAVKMLKLLQIAPLLSKLGIFEL